MNSILGGWFGDDLMEVLCGEGGRMRIPQSLLNFATLLSLESSLKECVQMREEEEENL